MFGRKNRTAQPAAANTDLVMDTPPSQFSIRRATRSRLTWDLIASLFLLITVVFLILVEIGDTNIGSSVATSTYFIKLNLTNVVPATVPNSQLINSIAQTLGLHDFYTVGLWGYCEGYNSQGVTQCSAPQTLYWFNPVQIIESQLFAGATIDLPDELINILSLIETVSHWMFGLFLTGACLSFVLIFLGVLSIYTRWATFPIAVLSFLNALFVTVAAVIATVMFIIMEDVFNEQKDLNIKASLGAQMFAFMWIAAAFSILAWLIQLGQLCCCASIRDVRTGRKHGSRHAYRNSAAEAEKVPAPSGYYGRR